MYPYDYENLSLLSSESSPVLHDDVEVEVKVNYLTLDALISLLELSNEVFLSLDTTPY